MTRAGERGNLSFRVGRPLIIFICDALLQLILDTTQLCLTPLLLLINLLNAQRSRPPVAPLADGAAGPVAGRDP